MHIRLHTASIRERRRSKVANILQCNSFFGGGSGAHHNSAHDATRNTLNKVFDKYRDDPANEPNEINAEGIPFKVRLVNGYGVKELSSHKAGRQKLRASRCTDSRRGMFHQREVCKRD